MEGIAGGRTSLVVLLPILLFGIFRVVRYLSRLWHMHRLTADIPGPTLPLLLRLWEARRSESRVSIVLHDVLRDHPIIYKFWSGPFLFVVIQNARDMEFVLSSKAITRKSFLYRMLAMVQGKGLIHMNYGEEWKRHRKIVSPFLGSDVLKDFVPVFHQKSMLMVRHMESYARTGRIFNIHSFVALVINDSVCQTVMSTNMASQENDELAFGKAMTDSLAIITYRTLQPWFLSNAIFRLSRHHHAFEKNIAILKDFMQRVLETKKRERSQEPPQELFLEAKDAALPRKRKPTFVDLMLDSSEDAAFSDREIKEEAQTLVSAAAGATTDALAFVLLCLSLRQDIQDKVIQELDDIFTWSPDRVTTEEDLRQMQYLERVIKETLRMFPSIPVFGRSVSKDMKLPSGHWVPAGAQVLMCTLGMHKDPHSFPEPNHFDPDRFLPENAAGRSAFSFLPFSAGPRNCVGQRYAYVQIKTTVSTLLRHYRLLPSLDDRHPRTIEDIKTNLMVTLSARAGYNLRLQRRRPLAA